MAGIVLCLSLGLFLVMGILLVKATMNKFFLVDLFSKSQDNSEQVINEINTFPRDERYKPEDAVGTLPKDYFIKDWQYVEDDDEQILDTSRWLAAAYENIWQVQLPKEKFILFDLSRDGYTNYKNADVIHGLIKKGILISSSLQLKFFSLSFRNFVLEKKNEPEMQEIMEQYDTGGMWQTIRNPLLMGVFAVMLFILVSRNDMSQYVTTFIAAATALIPLLLQALAPKKESKKEEGEAEKKA